MPRLQQILRGVRVEQGKVGRTPRPRLPITPGILKKMKTVWESEGASWDTAMPWAASSVAFVSFCRSGELTVPSEKSFDPSSHLTVDDVSVDNLKKPSVLAIQLKKSKTDPFQKGVNIALGRTQNELCPVSALLSYLQRRGKKPGPLFCGATGGHWPGIVSWKPFEEPFKKLTCQPTSSLVTAFE